jgi:hypothetical protein
LIIKNALGNFIDTIGGYIAQEVKANDNNKDLIIEQEEAFELFKKIGWTFLSIRHKTDKS